MKKLFTNLCGRAIKIALVVCALVIGGGNAALAQKSLPYSYGFGGGSESAYGDEGWTTYSLGTSSGILTYSGRTTANCFRFVVTTTPPQYLISPQFATSSTGLELSFYYKGGYSNTPVSFNVGYSTTDTSIGSFTWGDAISSNASSSYTEYSSILNISGIKYIAIKYNTTLPDGGSTNNYNLFIDDFSVSISNPYKTPTSFALSSFTTTSATFSWTAGNSETAWQFAYSTSSTFTPGTDGTTLDITTSDLVDGKYTLSGLTEGTTYYASIRADYGNGNYSEWSDRISFTPKAEIETTINDGSHTNSYVPFSGNSANGITNSQFIIPSSSLSDVNSRQITKLTFYSNSTNKSWGAAEFEVYMKETSKMTFSSAEYDSWGTCVFNSATLSVDADKLLTIELNTPFNYQGGNLQIGFKMSKKGSFSYNSFYGVNGSSYTTVYGYGTTSESISRAQFLPKITIISTPITTDPVQMGTNGYTTFASPRALDLANLPSGLKAYKAAVDGTKVLFTEINQTVPANTGMLLEGTANTTYAIPMAENGSTPDGNAFLVNSTGGTFTAETGYSYFGLMKDSGAPLVFGVFEPGTVAIPSNKAYLKVLTSSLSASRQLTCVFGDDTEGIQGVEQKALNSEVYYNLAGLKVEKPSKGLYIVNGKKVVIK